jgi:glutaminase
MGLLSVVVLAVVMTSSGVAQQRPDPQTAVNDAFNQFRTLKEGKNADYIPALAKVDPNLFGISLVTVLAAGGKNPVTGKQVMGAAKVPGVLAVMATAGLYDDSGKWLYHTGLPAKSGVGGGLIAVSPGNFGIAVVSPPLDDAGNSVRAQRAIAAVSNALGGNPLAPTAR